VKAAGVAAADVMAGDGVTGGSANAGSATNNPPVSMIRKNRRPKRCLSSAFAVCAAGKLGRAGRRSWPSWVDAARKSMQ
jgi:hypothetical protein